MKHEDIQKSNHDDREQAPKYTPNPKKVEEMKQKIEEMVRRANPPSQFEKKSEE